MAVARAEPKVLIVRESPPLSGRVEISGAKNSALKLMAASLMAEGKTVLRRVPDIADIRTMAELLRSMGAEVRRAGPDLEIDVPATIEHVAPYELVSQMRASISVLGPLVARCGRARVAMPGGCNLGSRPIDLHIKGLEQLGVEFSSSHGYLDVRAQRLQGARVLLDFPSVGATENLVMAAVRAEGTTVIENAAREPEIADLAAMLNRMGARIYGAGSSTIQIEGPADLSPVEHEVMVDRIETGTFLAAAGITGGEIVLAGGRYDLLATAISKFCDMGMLISSCPDGLWAKGPERLNATDIATLPYPGFPTDLQPMAVAMLAVAEGTSLITENVFDSRFLYTSELNRMGAQIRTDGRHAVIKGVPRLSGAPVAAPDLRAGAALVVAGLAAEGETIIRDYHHVERGYEHFVEKLRSLGAILEQPSPLEI